MTVTLTWRAFCEIPARAVETVSASGVRSNAKMIKDVVRLDFCNVVVSMVSPWQAFPETSTGAIVTPTAFWVTLTFVTCFVKTAPGFAYLKKKIGYKSIRL